jgi:hypothetical protein
MSRHALECGLLAGENRDVAIHVAGAAGVAGHAAAVGPARDWGRCGCMSLPWVGRSLAGWQFIMITLAASVNSALERAR